VQGIKVGNLVYTSGQVAIQDDGELVPGGFREQGEKVP
jgi:enamine deaminase RidA (YjgF/YER057c/UK114 family)